MLFIYSSVLIKVQKTDKIACTFCMRKQNMMVLHQMDNNIGNKCISIDKLRRTFYALKTSIICLMCWESGELFFLHHSNINDNRSKRIVNCQPGASNLNVLSILRSVDCVVNRRIILNVQKIGEIIRNKTLRRPMHQIKCRTLTSETGCHSRKKSCFNLLRWASSKCSLRQS